MEIDTLIAALVVSNLINWLLHGVLTVQLYIYYLAFPEDMRWVKAAVYTVYILETIQVIGSGTLLVLVLVDSPPPSHPGSTIPFYPYWFIPDHIWIAQALLIDFTGSLVPLISQCIYAHRIWIIEKRKDIPCLITALAILQLCAAILTAVYQVTIPFVVWTGLNIVNDLIISVIMVRSLLKEKLLSLHIKSKVIPVARLIMATGSLIVVANSLALFCSLNSIGGTVGMAILIFIPKLYANSILVMLNNRMTIKNSRNDKPIEDFGHFIVIGDHQTDSIESSGCAISREQAHNKV